MPAPTRRRVRTPAAAAYLSLTPRTLEKLRLRGGGPPYFKVGRCVIYDLDVIDEWLRTHERRSTSDPGPAGLDLPGVSA